MPLPENVRKCPKCENGIAKWQFRDGKNDYFQCNLCAQLLVTDFSIPCSVRTVAREKPKLGRRAEWFEVFFNIAKSTASRSRDETTRVGAVVVSRNQRILGTGYNGPPAGSKDLVMGGPVRHLWVIHAEENALLQAIASTGEWPLNDATLYVTHRPCVKCVVRASHSGVTKIRYLLDELSDEQRKDASFVEAELGLIEVRQYHETNE